jgi:predicted amidohydrolase YtcJ
MKRWLTTSLLGSLVLFFNASYDAYATSVLIENVKGYTLDDQGELLQFSRLLVIDGKVAKLDPKQSPSGVDTINGHGKVLLPGLIDAHGHMAYLGENLSKVDLRTSTSPSQAVDEVASFALVHNDEDWILGSGWNQELWPDKGFPTAKMLDQKISDKAVWLSRVDYHASWVNSKVLAIAGIDKNTPDPDGGKILRDANGEPTGVLIDAAMDLVTPYMPVQTGAKLSHLIDVASEHLLSLGITSVHDAGISHKLYQVYLAKAAEGNLPLRIYAMIWALDEQLDTMLDNGVIRSKDDFLFINSVKAMGDGALGSRGAALLKPYSDAPDQQGLMAMPLSAYPALFDKVLGAGFQLNIHAIGDKANRLALDQFEQSFATVGGRQFRNRIEHAQIIDVNDLPRFAQLGVLPSMQPTHATSDKNMAEDRIGHARMKGAYAWQTLLKTGIAMPLGSDFPVELANPFYGLHAAITRQDRNNQPANGWYPEETLTPIQAFRGFTLDAAYAAHMEDTLGTLTIGKWADFILIDQDIFTVPAQDVWKTQVIQTWVAGKKVFDANQSPK